MKSFVSILLAESSYFSVRLNPFIVSVLQLIPVLYMAVQRHFLQYRAILRITAQYSIRSLGLLCFRLRRIPAVPRWESVYCPSCCPDAALLVRQEMPRSLCASADICGLKALPIFFMPVTGVFRIRNAVPSAR